MKGILLCAEKVGAYALTQQNRKNKKNVTLETTAELPPNVKKKKSASFKYKLTKVPQPIKLVVRITLLVTFLKQLSEFYFLSN